MGLPRPLTGLRFDRIAERGGGSPWWRDERWYRETRGRSITAAADMKAQVRRLLIPLLALAFLGAILWFGDPPRVIATARRLSIAYMPWFLGTTAP